MEYTEYKEKQNEIKSNIQTLDVPLLIKSLQLRIALEKEFQLTGSRVVNKDFDRGYSKACDTINEYLDRVVADWT